MKAWWFSNGKTLPYGDNRRIAIGRTHKIKGEIIPCRNALHASIKPIDALPYAPGPILWRVEMGGEIIRHDDNLAASERTYIAGGVDVSDGLRKFARRCALDVLHMWEPPEVVVEYLKTGDEGARAAARAASWPAAWSAARAASWPAARGAARGAARDVAWSAAWSAARAAARAAARDAAWAAARDAAWDAARDAAWDAAWEKQNKRLTAMLTHAIRRG